MAAHVPECKEVGGVISWAIHFPPLMFARRNICVGTACPPYQAGSPSRVRMKYLGLTECQQLPNDALDHIGHLLEECAFLEKKRKSCRSQQLQDKP